MKNRNYISFLCFFLAILFFFGRQNHRIFYANIVGKSFYFPLLNSIEVLQSVFMARGENEKLLEKVTELQLKVVDLESGIRTLQNVAILKEIYHNSENTEFKICEVIGYSGTYKERNIIINRGYASDIETGFPVIHRNGIVGKIITTTLNTATILPLTHSRFKCAVLDKRSRVQGMLESDLNGNSYMSLIPTGSSVAVGDTIITSNISTIFPKGIPVGVIQQIILVPGETFVKAKVNPFVPVNDLEQVVVLFYEKEKVLNEGEKNES